VDFGDLDLVLLFPSCAVAQVKAIVRCVWYGRFANRPYQSPLPIALTDRPYQCVEKLHKCNLGEVVCSKSVQLLLPLALW